MVGSFRSGPGRYVRLNHDPDQAGGTFVKRVVENVKAYAAVEDAPVEGSTDLERIRVRGTLRRHPNSVV